MRDAFIRLHLSVVIAGFTGIFGRLIGLSEVLLVWWRLFIMVLLFTLLLKVMGKLRMIAKADFFPIARAGVVLMLHWIFFYASIKESNVSVGVVCFTVTSFFTTLLTSLFDRSRVQWRELFLSVLTLVGVSLIFTFDTKYRTGILLGVISSFLAALFTVMNKRLSALHHPSSTLLLYEMIGGFIGITLLLPFYLYILPQSYIIPSGLDLLWLLLFVVVCTIGLYILQIQALKKISAFTVTLSYNLEPVYSILLAMLIFGEGREMNLAFCVGLGLTLLSVALQTLFAYLK